MNSQEEASLSRTMIAARTRMGQMARWSQLLAISLLVLGCSMDSSTADPNMSPSPLTLAELEEMALSAPTIAPPPTKAPPTDLSGLVSDFPRPASCSLLYSDGGESGSASWECGDAFEALVNFYQQPLSGTWSTSPLPISNAGASFSVSKDGTNRGTLDIINSDQAQIFFVWVAIDQSTSPPPSFTLPANPPIFSPEPIMGGIPVDLIPSGAVLIQQGILGNKAYLTLQSTRAPVDARGDYIEQLNAAQVTFTEYPDLSGFLFVFEDDRGSAALVAAGTGTRFSLQVLIQPQ